MQSFSYWSPTEVVFGKGAESQVANLVKKYGGSRVLLVYGGGSVVRSGLLPRVKKSLEDAGIVCEELGGVQPNPLLSLAEEGVKKAVAFGADFILPVGGGSAIDTGKAIAIGAKRPDVSLWGFWTKDMRVEEALPHGCILTIPAAGSETSDSAVLTNQETRSKRGLSVPENRPKFAVMNPELTFTLPPYQVACGIVDIMMHTMDRYFTPTHGNETTDGLAEALLRVVIRNGRAAMEHPGDYDAMSELMWCGSLSHNGLTGLGAQTDFSTHQLGHELSAMFDLAHGASLAAMWGAWASYCLGTNPARFAQFGRNVWGVEESDDLKAGEEAIRRTTQFFSSLGMPVCFSDCDFGVQSDDIVHELAKRCTFYGARTVGALRVLKEEDLYCIYKAANH